jgi:hypothetical protein
VLAIRNASRFTNDADGQSNSGVPAEFFSRLLGRLPPCSRNAYVLTRPHPVRQDAPMMRCKVKQ